MNVKNLVRPWIHSLDPYPPGKPIDELEREYGVTDSIKLASNENPLGPSPKALAALQGALADIHRYPDGSCYHLKRGLARKLRVSPESLIFGNGSNEIIELVVRTFLHAGEEAVMADQAFVIYRMLVQAQGGKSLIVPLRNFTHDLEAMAEAITPATRLVFLANPNNPTGTIFFREQWEEFLAAVPRDVIIVMDEAYAEFVEDPRYPDALADVGADHLLIVLRTFSKIYGLAGLRVGYGVAHPAIIDLLNRLRAPFNVNTLAQVAALAALDDDAHVERTRQGNREGMAVLREALTGLGYECVPSWANFILVRVGNAARLYDALLRLGVIVRPVPVYGFPEHVRVTVGTPAENARLIAALTKLKGDEEGAALRFERAAIVGVGLIGGSLALAARAAGLIGEAIGVGRSEANLAVARERGLVDRTVRDLADLGAVDLVVLAVPVRSTGAVARALLPHLAPGAVLTDVGSVKGEVVATMDALLPADRPFVGGHPIAGSERAGAAAATADLFRGARCILTPTPRTDRAAVGRVRALWEGVGARVDEMSPAAHDQALAWVSHLPHVVAYALVRALAAADPALAAFAGGSWRDATRVAASSPELWRDIFLANAEAVGAATKAFGGELEQLRAVIASGDTAALSSWLDEAVHAKAAQRPGGSDE